MIEIIWILCHFFKNLELLKHFERFFFQHFLIGFDVVLIIMLQIFSRLKTILLLISNLIEISIINSITLSNRSGLKSQNVNTDARNSHSVKYFSYTNEIVTNEYIVKFKHYHQPEVRHRYIEKSLQKLSQSCKNFIENWLIVKRSNIVTDYPSDFDILRINKNISLGDLKITTVSHPEIQSISLNRKFTRSLKVINSTIHFPLNDEFSKISNQQIDFHSRKLLRAIPNQITEVLQAEKLWRLGITGNGVKVAIFDTGLARSHKHFRKIKDLTNWTNEKTSDDTIGHGTFVAGLIASSQECLGFAPDAELYIFKVFTKNQISYTSWFLDAFNYAILKKINVLNLSIGGPDFMDHPFIDKVWELTANNVIMISAIGNDGPLYGTLNNPADQMDVIGIGGIDFDDHIAKFSSRGMTTWELPSGYGRVKPDIVTYGQFVSGSDLEGGCRVLSGTSVASPVVTGAVTLLMSGVLDLGAKINPASMKQSLISSAQRLPDVPMFEQGAGKLDLLRAYQTLRAYEPQSSLFPSYIDFQDCPYMWPYCEQPLYHKMMPLIINVTILNGMSVTGFIKSKPKWHPYLNHHGNYIKISISYSEVLWPWSGWIALHVSVSSEASDWEGVIQGHVSLTVESFSKGNDFTNLSSSDLVLPVKLKIIPTPPRNKRILWDQYHNLRYPPGYFPRDNLKTKPDSLDWNADHIHTNFREVYQHLRLKGFFIEILGQPYTCFDAEQYGSLLLIDPEEEFFPEEIDKLYDDFRNGLSVIIFADWYNVSVMQKIQFYDENTRQWWLPVTGGSNIPALNDLLSPWKLVLSDQVIEGTFKIGNHDMYYASGTSIIDHSEAKNFIGFNRELNDQGSTILGHKKPSLKPRATILGLLKQDYSDRSKKTGGLAVYGDSNCLDQVYLEIDCYWLLDALLQFSTTGKIPSFLQQEKESANDKNQQIQLNIEKFINNQFNLKHPATEKPKRANPNNLYRYSNVINDRNGTFRMLPNCHKLFFEIPEAINETLPNDLYENYSKLHLLQTQVDLEQSLATASSFNRFQKEKLSNLVEIKMHFESKQHIMMMLIMIILASIVIVSFLSRIACRQFLINYQRKQRSC
ncbi:uncharacterized protein NH340_JMT05057 [Sarcoptes scabiei]|nr:uncharacterized protein NH340_JMT05057 [Sarcoptes scabiei]